MDGWQQVAGQLAQIGLPSLGTLVGNALVPGLGGMVGGAGGKLVASAIATALGVEPTPQAVSQAIQADPSGASLKLAQIDAESRAYLAELADIQNARGTMLGLAQAGSKIAYAPAVVSGLIVIGFLALTTLLIFRQVPDSQAALILFGNLATAFGAVVQYWIGTSESARRNADTVRQFAATAVAPAIAPVLPAAPPAGRRR